MTCPVMKCATAWQWRSQSKIWETKMLDFRRATVLVFGRPLLKARND